MKPFNSIFLDLFESTHFKNRTWKKRIYMKPREKQ